MARAKKLLLVCTGCGKRHWVEATQEGLPRLPAGWKRLGSDAYERDCWNAAFMLRTQVLPIAAPLADDPQSAWEELWTTLRPLWKRTGQLMTYLVQLCAAADTKPLVPCQTKNGKAGWRLPPMPWPDLNPLARRFAPELDSQSCYAVVRRTRKAYDECRFAVRILAKEAWPAWKDMTPLPFQAKDAAVRLRAAQEPGEEGGDAASDDGDNQRAELSLRLASGRRFELRLRGGSEFHRQMEALRLVHAGKALQGEVSIYPRRYGGGHYGAGRGREKPGANKTRWRIMVGIACWLPRPALRQGGHTLLVMNHPESFLVAELSGRKKKGRPGFHPWRLNGDQVKRWEAEHALFLQRFREDMKYEKRWPKPVRQAMNDFRRKRVHQHRERIKDWNFKSAASLLNYAERQAVNVLVFDHSCRDFLPSYPWAEFANVLRDAGEGKGISVRIQDEDASHEGE